MIGVVSILGFGCSKKDKAKDIPELSQVGATKTAEAPAHAPAAEEPSRAELPGSAKGVVAETMDSGGYTYVKLTTGSGEIWAAGPQTPIQIGDKISYEGGMPMRGFHSDSLNRTFELVFFVPKLTVNGAGGAAEAPAAPGAAPHASVTSPQPGAAAVDLKDIKKADHTVAEVFSGKTGLADKVISIRGKVVKYNAGIMGRNWIHIQDGSGEAGSNDLTVTTQINANLGDTVLVKGKLSLNKDFGGGYKYDVILEDANITVE